MIYNIPWKKIAVLLLVLFVVWLGYILVWFGNVKFNNTNEFTTITLGGEPMTTEQLSAGIKLRPGKHTVQAFGPFVRPQTYTITVSPFQTAELSLEAQKLSAEQVFGQLATEEKANGYNVELAKLLENNTWMIAYVNDPNGQREGYTKIYRFDGRNWVVHDSGTGFDLEGYYETSLPESVIRFLQEGE
jgi:hypothetical protein